MSNSKNIGTVGLRYPTDYHLQTLNLVTPLQGNGIINLMPFMLELNLYEDLYSSTISGEIVLQDALGLISGYTFNGTEFLEVQLKKTAEDGVFYSRNFRVYKVGKRSIGDSNNYEVYTLVFCSEEFLLSEQYRISKSFKGQQISTIVSRIFTDYLKVDTTKGKPVYIEETVGNYDFILPNKKIFETVNWLSTYAKTTESAGDLVFFENSKGYFFASLSTLFKTQVYRTYRFDPKNISDDMNQKLQNVSDFEVLDFYDTLAGITNGTFANKVITLNVLQRKVNRTTGIFNYGNYFTISSNLNENPIINNYQNRLGATMYDMPPVTIPGLEAGCLRMSPSNADDKKNEGVIQKEAIDSVANDIDIEKYMPNRVARLALANYMKIKVTIPGDPNLTVGKVVNFETFKIQPTTYSESRGKPNRPLDPLYSGKYLVTAVRHIVKNNEYITVMEMCKDSHTGQIASYDNENPVLKRLVNGIQAPGQG